MSNESLVHNLYAFIKSDATMEKLQEANKKAFPVKEGKLPDDPSLIKDPDGDIQKLSEKEEKKTQDKAEKEADAAVNKDIETANAGKTEEPEKTDLQKEAEKETPTDKLTQDKAGQDPAASANMKKAAEEKKITPEITGVEKVKESMSVEDLAKELGVDVAIVKRIKEELEEGKLPADPSQVKSPEEEIQQLAEEKVLTTVSDEKVAKDIASKYPGSRIVKDEQGKAFMVMVKETKKCTCGGKCHEGREVVVGDQVSLPGNRYGEIVKVANGTAVIKTSDNKMVQRPSNDPDMTIVSEKKVKEDITVTIDDEKKETTVKALEDGAVQVNTVAKAEEVPAEEAPVVTEPVVEEEPEFFKDETEMTDEQAEEMAEKITVMDYLKAKKTLTEKQRKFLNEVKGVKMGKKNKQKVGKALKQLAKKK